tara:strand:+ start:5894 stop:6937 length:1044 start_codon:yes stop_codon:yes gene_type:complete
MELNNNQMYRLIERFPKFDNSYETVSQKGYTNDYNIALAIPTGKKSFIWFTYYRNYDVCYLFDLNKEKKIVKSTQIMKEDYNPLCKGTVLYGTSITDEETNNSYFVIEDIYYHKGIHLHKNTFYDKLFYIKDVLDIVKEKPFDIQFNLPVLWQNQTSTEIPTIIPSDIINKIGYQTHHIQYRTNNIIKPHINIVLNKKINTGNDSKNIQGKIYIARYTIDTFKPQYRQRTVFQVNADLQFDIYHLHAFGKNNSLIYYNIAYIPDYKTSVFMNGLFRNIRENKDLDYIEESEDESDFQNINEDKYVDTNKVITMECVFHARFKRWIPVNVINYNCKIIHISRLVKDYY